LAGARDRNLKDPSAPVTCVMGAPALGIKVTMTPGSGFPSGSTTLPKIFPVLICELREIAAISTKNAAKTFGVKSFDICLEPTFSIRRRPNRLNDLKTDGFLFGQKYLFMFREIDMQYLCQTNTVYIIFFSPEKQRQTL
jgi:hypothetical protein